jgi:hypothetical protein
MTLEKYLDFQIGFNIPFGPRNSRTFADVSIVKSVDMIASNPLHPGSDKAVWPTEFGTFAEV